MPFTADFCVATPAHETILGVCPASFTTVPVDNIAATALSEANYVNDLIAALNANADASGEAALAVIKDLADYQAPQLPAVIYTAPTWLAPPIHLVGADALVTNAPPQYEDGVEWNPPVLNDVSAPDANILAPTINAPDSPPAPILGTPPVSPNAPAAYDPDVAPAPAFSAPAPVFGEATAPELADIIVALPGSIELSPLVVSIDYSAIERAIDMLNNITLPAEAIPDYELLIPEVFTVVGSMLTGDAVDRSRIADDGREARRVMPSLTKRGLAPQDSVAGYDAWLDGIVTKYIADSETLFAAKYRDEVISSAYVVAAEAEKMLINISLGVYDARFEYAIAWASSNLAVAKGIVAAYNAETLAFEASVLEYNAALLQVTAAAQAVAAEAEGIDTIGRMNKLLAREFAISEDVKKSEVQAFKALVSAESAKLEAFKAQLSAKEAEVAKARSAMMAYVAEVTGYSAEVQGAKNQYQLYSAEAKSVSSQNDMTKIEVRGGAIEAKAIAVEAASLASGAGVEAVRKMRISKTQTAEHESSAANNAVASYDIAGGLGSFISQSALLRADTAQDSVEPKAVAAIGDAISRFTKTAIMSAATAASMAQAANDSLARAYARAYEASGRAGAAVASGKLSGFRASAAISAVGNLQASKTRASRESYSGSLNYAESDSAVQSIST